MRHYGTQLLAIITHRHLFCFSVFVCRRVAPFIADMLRKLTARFPDISIWMAALVSANVPDGFMVEYMTLPLRCVCMCVYVHARVLCVCVCVCVCVRARAHVCV